MTDIEGAAVRRRRLRLGMTLEQLADEAGLSADTLGDFEAGTRSPRSLTVAKIVEALDRLELAGGLHAPETSQPTVRYTVEGVYGAKSLVVEGPVANLAELEASVDRIMRRMQMQKPDTED